MKMSNIKTVKITSPVHGITPGTVMTRENADQMFANESFTETEQSRYSYRIELGEKMLNKGNCMIVETFKSDSDLNAEYLNELEEAVSNLTDNVNKLKQEVKELLTEKGDMRTFINNRIEQFEDKYDAAESDMYRRYMNGELEYGATEAMTVYANVIEALKQIKA